MKNAAIMLVGGLVAILVLYLVFHGSGDSSDDISSRSVDGYGRPGYVRRAGGGDREKSETESQAKPTVAADEDKAPLTTDEFRSLSQEQQDAAMQEFVASFWETETGADRQEEKEYLSLEIFERPYMMTVTESDYWKLSPEDQERLMEETTQNCKAIRSHILDTVAQARECGANGYHTEAEAYLISGLERGRELNADKEGMFITRIVGIACQKAALKEMVRLYTKTDQHSKVAMAQQELVSLESEMDEMRAIGAQQGGG